MLTFTVASRAWIDVRKREREIRKGGNTARVARITEIMLPRVSLDRGPFAIRELVRHFHGFND